MAIRFLLYVDEISPDKIKATVSNSSSVAYNLRTMLFATNPFYAHSFRGAIEDSLGEEINGICIVPAGKFICMVVRQEQGKGMVFLDLTGKAALAEKMAEKLDHVELRQRFLQVYAGIVKHPEEHKKVELVLGRVGNQN